MIEHLYNIDLAVFYFFNHTLSNPLFDKFFPFITEVNHWYIAYLVLLLFLTVRGGVKGRLAAFFVLLLVTATDQFSSTFVKHTVERIRPCNVLHDANILASCTSSFSFPSSHAVNNFAVAVFFIMLYPKYKWELLITAFLISISRIYCGVHYPSDVLGGALIGAAFGFIFGFITIKSNQLYMKKFSKE